MVFEIRPPSDTDEQGRRIVEATLRIVARYGLAKLTLDDVAREAGCSRATLYRRFPGKTVLLEAVVASESARLQSGLDAALAEVGTLADAMAAVAAFGAHEFENHAALQFLLAYEPGAVLPHVTFAGADRLLELLAGSVAPHLGRFMPGIQAKRAGEWLARIVLSYGCTPLDPRVQAALGDGPEATVVSIVRDFVAPAFAAEASRESGESGEEADD
ncbi:MAG TPA: TetR/AcrR family transcriptional regulator [Acidimicrobiia bacterium]|nr:TetR/AcrR family transcriptional regulator [Acidimicrobiia bacterium]